MLVKQEVIMFCSALKHCTFPYFISRGINIEIMAREKTGSLSDFKSPEDSLIPAVAMAWRLCLRLKLKPVFSRREQSNGEKLVSDSISPLCTHTHTHT